MKQHKRSAKVAGLTLALTGLIPASLLAGDYAKAVIDDKAPVAAAPWGICDFLDASTLYENDSNPVIQKFALTGRAQVDAAFFDADQGKYESFHWRRFRSGFKAKLFQDWTLHSEADFNFNDPTPAYNRLTDTYLAWSKSEALKIKIGKQSAPFTLDGETSSKKLMTMERSNVSNNFWFPTEYHSGISAGGKIDNWVYLVGAYSATGGKEFGDFDAAYFGLLSIGYEFGDALSMDRALVRMDYVNQPEDAGNNGTRDLAQSLSLVGKFEQGDLGLWTDISFGDGYQAQSDIFGLQLMPFYNINDSWQAVFRYTYVNSSNANGVRLDRYENRIVGGRVNEAHEFYAGINRYFCGHKLKWQTGVEYTHAIDEAADGGAYAGWGLTTGIRVSW